MFKKEIYIDRRKKLTAAVKEGIILLPGNVDSPMNYADNIFPFRQDSSFLYFLGLDFPGLAAVIDADSGESILFGDDITVSDIIWMGAQPGLRKKAEHAGVKETMPFDKLAVFVNDAIARGRKVHFLPPYRAENKILLSELTGIHTSRLRHYASLELIKAIVALRSVKEPCEIEEMKDAWRTGCEMHLTAMKMTKPGAWEQTIAGTVANIPMRYGGFYSFSVILSQRGEILHNHAHDAILQEGKLLLVDAGAENKMRYASDFTRTFPVSGKFTQQQREVYDIVLAANNRAKELVKPGVTYLSVHLAAAEVIATGLKELGVMKGDVQEAVTNGAHALFMPHGLGHMMGLDVHDMEDLGQIYVGYDEETRPSTQFGTAYLRMGRKLETGFVVTNEPGIYFIPALIDKWKAEKINHDFINFKALERYLEFGGIRLEDALLVTQAGCDYLGERLPIEPEDVEAAVNS